MSNSITDFLAAILSAKYGEQVRGAIHDAIELCYQDGKAGVNDLEARHLIEQVIGVNEMQDAGIETLTARVEALEQGGEGESAGTTTTTVPTFIVDHGIANFSNVQANKTATMNVTFAKTFTEAPVVVAIKVFRNGPNTFYSLVTAQPVESSITTTGFTLAVGNRYTQAVSPSVLWIAFQPTEIEINTEIIVPSGGGMTEAEVRELLAPISAALNGIKTGYDGTVYDTPGEAVRTQINDLHVLIGDTPGTAIQASAVAYNDSNVAAELTNVNGRLQEQQTAIGGIAEVSYSRNLYNPDELKTGINILPTGEETANNGYASTDFLPIDGIVCISCTIGYDIGAAGGRVLLYDANKSLITDGSHDVARNTYTSDSALQRNYWTFSGTDAKYVRLRGLNAMWADGYKIQIEASSTHTAYTAYVPPKYALKDGTITAEMFAENAVQDALNYYGTIETITGSYYKTYTKDFVQGKSYLITLVSKTNTAPIVFYGVIEGTNRVSVFTLNNDGQSYLFTPTRNFIGLYWGSPGSYTITINNMDGFEEKLPHVFYCGANREYTTLKSAIEAATLFMDSILYVDAGTYDIIQEFGADYFAGLTSNSTSLGIKLKNRIHIIFSPNSKVVCHYTGDNQYACSVFSPFHVFEYGFTIENLNLECSRVRYAFHDERNGGIEQCQSIFKNCRMVIDNSQNEYWNSKTCIGGGLGSNHEVRIEDCIFDTTASGLNAGVYYHQSNNTSNPNHKANITIKDCYFVNGTVTLQMARTDATEDTNIIITNNNFPNIAQTDSEGVYLNGMTATHVNVFAWNNKKRTA